MKNEESFVIKELVDVNELNIQDLVYDFHDDALYWSTRYSSKIMRMKNLQKSKVKEVFYVAGDEVSGLELDTCNRNLYFTTTSGDNPSINVIPIDKKTKARSFGTDHVKPIAISLDHQSRRLYVADVKKYSSYSIDSYSSTGSDFRNEISSSYNSPRSIAVDKNFVYYVEGDSHFLRRFEKLSDGKKTSNVMMKFNSDHDPSDIIVRNNFIVDFNQKTCHFNSANIQKVKNDLENSKPKEVATIPTKNCLHGGNLDKMSSNCVCKEDFDGEFCEIHLCYNFCLNNGDCSMRKDLLTQKLEPHCSCKSGFTGAHCELDVCNNFCLNNGKCFLDHRNEPTCDCKSDFTGARCEVKVIEVPSTTITIIDTINSTTTSVPINMPYEDLISNCPSPKVHDFPPILLYIAVGGFAIASLLVILLTFLLCKRRTILRPKPHKKYVIHKKMDNLTYRPTTEQCEVVIEDCCNMNICETVTIHLI